MSPISSGRIRNHRTGVILFPGTISCFPGQNFQTMESLHIPLKINVVLQQNVNAGEWKDLVLLAKDHPLDVRFIELMPIGYGKELFPISNSELLEKLTFTFGSLILKNDLMETDLPAIIISKDFRAASALSVPFMENSVISATVSA